MTNPILIIGPLLLLVSVIIPIIIIVFVVKAVKRSEQRANEKLQIEKDNITFQQQQMLMINEINQRLTNIEKMLKEVE